MRYGETLSGKLTALTGAVRHFSFTRHYHEAYAIGVMTAGRAKMHYRGVHHVGCEGDLVLITPGELHDGFTVDDEGWSYSMVYLDVEAIHRLSSRASPPVLFPRPFVRDPGIFNRLRAGIGRLWSRGEGGKVLLRLDGEGLGLIRDAFCQAAARFSTGYAANPRRNAKASRVASIIDENFRAGLSLDDLRAAVGLDRSALVKQFKRSIGLPPHQYLMMRRAQSALTEICRGKAAIDAALDNGFSDQSHMCRVIKKFSGITPSQVLHECPPPACQPHPQEAAVVD
jgi:AraC-like DNA-binding protein